MPRQIVLLTEPSEIETLLVLVRKVDGRIPVSIVTNKRELIRCPALKVAGTRLIAFCSSTIVPKEVLDGLDMPAYNFHPGPPEIPGLYPSIWAIYHGHQHYGVTAHVLYPEIDAGPIVAVDRTELPKGLDRLQVDIMARDMVYDLFARLAPALIGSDQPLAHQDDAWGPYRYTRKDFNDLCLITPDVSAEEFTLRLRALGEGPEHALTVPMHGRLFKLAPEGAEYPVYRAGVEVFKDET